MHQAFLSFCLVKSVVSSFKNIFIFDIEIGALFRSIHGCNVDISSEIRRSGSYKCARFPRF